MVEESTQEILSRMQAQQIINMAISHNSIIYHSNHGCHLKIIDIESTINKQEDIIQTKDQLIEAQQLEIRMLKNGLTAARTNNQASLDIQIQKAEETEMSLRNQIATITEALRNQLGIT